MKLSIYPQIKFLPKSKEDKIKQSMLASKPNFPEIVVIDNEDELIDIISSYGWSPCVFSGYRHNDNFISSDFMSLDIDSGLTIEEAEERVKKLKIACLCLPSPSHTSKNHKFRLVFPLAKTIFNSDDFEATWKWLQDQFPELDKQCSDLARWYAPSKMDDGFWQDGDFLIPKKVEKSKDVRYNVTETYVEVPENLSELVEFIYGKKRESIPESVEFFLANASSGLPGLWINSLNSFCFSLALSGVSDEIIWDVVEKVAPEPLDNKDEYQIIRSIKDGRKKGVA